jgi:hypothetical protein
MNINTRNIGNVESIPEQEEFYNMVKEWLDKEIKEFDIGLTVN